MTKTIDDIVRPLKHTALSEEEVQAFYRVVKKIGQFELEGRGQEFQSDRPTSLQQLVKTTDSLDAFNSDSARDRTLQLVSVDKRQDILNWAFSVELGTPEVSPPEILASEFAYLDNIDQEIIPELKEFVSRLPKVWQERPQYFFSNGFYQQCVSLYQNVLCERVVEITDGNAGRDIVAPLGYVRNRIVATEEGEHVISDFPEKVRTKYREASNPYNWMSKKSRKEHPEPDKEDYVDYSIASLLFHDDPAALGGVLLASRRLAAYGSDPEEYGRIVAAVKESLAKKRLRLFFDQAKYEAEATEHLEAIAELPRGADKQADETTPWRALLQDHALATAAYRAAVIQPLTARRTIVGESNEGLLRKEEGLHCESLEKRLHDELGFVWSYVYKFRDSAINVLRKHRGSQAAGVATTVYSVFHGGEKISPENLFSMQGDKDVRVDPFPTLATYTLPVVAIFGGREAIDRLRDNAPFYSARKAVTQVFQYARDGKLLDLLGDFWEKKEIPDNPTDASVVEYDRVIETLAELGSAVGPYNKNVLEKRIKKISRRDLGRDEDCIPTLAVIGALAARTNDLPMARRYLGMAGIWADYAVKELNLPATEWSSFAKYERSKIEVTQENRDAFLLQSFMALRFDQLDGHPFYTAEKPVGYHALTNPMNFAIRKDWIRSLPQTQAYRARQEALKDISRLLKMEVGDERKAILETYQTELTALDITLQNGQASPENGRVAQSTNPLLRSLLQSHRQSAKSYQHLRAGLSAENQAIGDAAYAKVAADADRLHEKLES